MIFLKKFRGPTVIESIVHSLYTPHLNLRFVPRTFEYNFEFKHLGRIQSTTARND